MYFKIIVFFWKKYLLEYNLTSANGVLLSLWPEFYFDSKTRGLSMLWEVWNSNVYRKLFRVSYMSLDSSYYGFRCEVMIWKFGLDYFFKIFVWLCNYVRLHDLKHVRETDFAFRFMHLTLSTRWLINQDYEMYN